MHVKQLCRVFLCFTLLVYLDRTQHFDEYEGWAVAQEIERPLGTTESSQFDPVWLPLSLCRSVLEQDTEPIEPVLTSSCIETAIGTS